MHHCALIVHCGKVADISSENFVRLARHSGCLSWVQVYCQPIFESFDNQFGNILAPVWCAKNTMVRLVCRSTCIILGCFIACLLPFFGDIM